MDQTVLTYTEGQHRAKRMVNDFVKSAKIERPTSCTICGTSDTPIQAHHPDPYKKPLEVVWCCHRKDGCHYKLETGSIPLEPWMLQDYDYLKEREVKMNEDGTWSWEYREGCGVSEETRNKMSESRKLWWQRKWEGES